MTPEVGSALVSAGGSLFGGIFDTIFGANEAAKQRNFAREMYAQQTADNQLAATVAFNRQNYLIDKQNDYNSYGNQRKLMEEAGYNPNLMASGSAGSAVSNSSTAAPQAATATPMQYQAFKSELGHTIADSARLYAESKLMEAQAKKVNAESGVVEPLAASAIALNDAQKAKLVKEADNVERTNKLFDATYLNQVKESQLRVDLSKKQLEFFDAQMYNMAQRLNMDKQTFEYNYNVRWPKEVEELATKIGCNKAAAAMYYSNAALQMSMKAGQDIMNGYNKAVFGSEKYQQNVRALAYYNALKAKYQGVNINADTDYIYARTLSEQKGYPYLKSIPWSESRGDNLFGIGSNSSRSGSMIMNPTLTPDFTKSNPFFY